jgi:DNA-binding NarL/FixJ family response regulator
MARASDLSVAGTAESAGIRLLVADDDDRLRSLFAELFRGTVGVSSVLEAGDGDEAVDLARDDRLDVVVLDFKMPRVDGVDAARQLRALRPSLRVAVHSTDPELLRACAEGLDVDLFDKADYEGLIEWVELQASALAATAKAA